MISEEKIIELLRSENERQKNEGVYAFIDKYQARVVKWIAKQQIKVSQDDVWQEAASLMIMAISTGKYQKKEDVALYTYFFYIIKSTWIKYAKHEMQTVALGKEELYLEEENNDFRPDIYTELLELKSFIKNCLEKFDEKTHQLLNEILLDDARLIDIYESYKLKNYNNAKQKYHKAKHLLINCLKTQLGYGK